jgi:hypothetical protein
MGLRGQRHVRRTLRNAADGLVSGTYYSRVVATARVNKSGDSKYAMV